MIIKMKKYNGPAKEVMDSMVWDLEKYDDLAVFARDWANLDTLQRDEVFKIVDDVSKPIGDKVLKLAGSRRL